MGRKNNHQVLIAGAGPAGLAAALLLDRQNIDVEVIDPREAHGGDEIAVILHPDSLARLAELGIALDGGDDARRIDLVTIYDRNRWRADVTLGPPTGGAAAVIPRWRLEKRLEAALKDRGVKVSWNHRVSRIDVTDDHAVAEVDRLELDSAGYATAVTEKIVGRSHRHTPAFLIGADGRESVIRNQLRTGWRSIAPAELAVAVELDTSLELAHEARIVLGDAATALWPLPGGGVQVTFHLPASEVVPDADRLGEPEVRALLHTHVPGFDQPIKVRHVRVERVVPGHADRPGRDRAWLLGDAARLLPVAASGSLNQGLRDADLLAAALAHVPRGRAAHELLDELSAATRARTVGAIQLGEAYLPGPHAAAFVASAYGRVVPLLPVRGDALDEAARQLGLVAAPR